MKIHFVGVSGTGMGSLALLYRAQGHEVTGSDASFDPPMGPALEAGGVTCLKGYSKDHLFPTPDVVIVGNAIRRDNEEATYVREHHLHAESMSGALRSHFLAHHRPLVVTGTHGKTTTSSLCAWILHKSGQNPGYFIGGIPKNFPSGAGLGETKRKLASSGKDVALPGAPAPFVVEGDEYDAVYWHKKPKFLDYVGVGQHDVVVLTSVEHDHVDIYPTAASYEEGFREMVDKIPEGGLLVVDARDARARHLAKACKAKVVYYALDGDDTGDVTPTWLGAVVGDAARSDVTGGGSEIQSFDLFIGGMSCGRLALKVPGAHNIRNAIGAMAACCEAFGVKVADARSALAEFDGVRRRQDLLGTPSGINVYDDFAHHPTAVDETLRALKTRHPKGALFAIFEPRSATACRALHQEDYVGAFSAAEHVIFAPLGRTNIPENERLDLGQLAARLGPKALCAAGVDQIIDYVKTHAKSGDTVALLSNGAFGGIHAKMLESLK
jgi:UDP-N-acetylmuramate: L-alanyl-gamma-D-glutamyl-meso-diaminopimelate ligase